MRLVWIGAREDNIVLVAGGVAFFSLLSAAPALAAMVSLYGIVADPAGIAARVNDLGATMPPEAKTLITNELTTMAADRSGLGIGLVVSLVIALWGASTAMKHLMVALTQVFQEQETRGFVRQRLTAMAYTLATIVFLAVVAGLVAISSSISGVAGTVVAILRWPMLALLMVGGLTLLYRYGPDRPRPAWRWVDRGALLATALWVSMTLAFSGYAGRLGSYNQTYGALAGLVLFMLWLLVSALAVLIGAEVDVEFELAARDT